MSTLIDTLRRNQDDMAKQLFSIVEDKVRTSWGFLGGLTYREVLINIYSAPDGPRVSRAKRRRDVTSSNICPSRHGETEVIESPHNLYRFCGRSSCPAALISAWDFSFVNNQKMLVSELRKAVAESQSVCAAVTSQRDELVAEVLNGALFTCQIFCVPCVFFSNSDFYVDTGCGKDLHGYQFS